MKTITDYLLYAVASVIALIIFIYSIQWYKILSQLRKNYFYWPYIKNRYFKKHSENYIGVLETTAHLIDEYQYVKADDCDDNYLSFSKRNTCKPILLDEVIDYLEGNELSEINELNVNLFSHKLLAQIILSLFDGKYSELWSSDEEAVLMYCTYVQILNWALKNNLETEEEVNRVRRELIHKSHNIRIHMPF